MHLIANYENPVDFKLFGLCGHVGHSIYFWFLVILGEVTKCKISIFRLNYFPLVTHHGCNLVYESCSDSCFLSIYD